MPGEPTAICIVSHSAYGALVGGREGQLGGVERQTSLLARWLAERGHAVSLVTWDEGQPDEHTVAGVRVLKTCRPQEGIPGLRFLYPRWSSLNRALAQADAQVYYHNCGEHVTGQVAWWCTRHRRRFVFSSASDFDCDRRLPGLASMREKALYRYGLRHADPIIVQTARQQAMMGSGFGLRAIVLPMPCPGPSELEYEPPQPPAPDTTRVLWVGRIARGKRLEWLLDVADQIPTVTFDVAGVPDPDDEYTRAVVQRARQCPNLNLLGRVARDEMPALYRRAALLCCSSAVEGFPNTFLEAWSHGVPLVTTFDPDDLVAARGLGLVAHDPVGLADGVRQLVSDRALWSRLSANARQYFVENHAVDPVMRRYEEIFVTLAAPSRPPGSLSPLP